jgi:heme o synthase
LASKHHFYPLLLAETLGGLALVIASACVFNNYLDRGIDKKMARTQKRALVTNEVGSRTAIFYASALGVLGFSMMAVFVNFLAVWLCAAAIFSYVVLYGWAKRSTVHGTLVGSVPGALPPVIGYAAVSNHIDGASVFLFLILVSWQMPHFYAIAMYRFSDYKAAGLPVLPVKKGMGAAKLQIKLYIAAFIVSVSALTFFGYTGFIYLLGAVGLGIFWLWKGIYGLKSLGYEKWGRKMFFYSLIVNLGISILIAVGGLLP